MPGTRVNIAVNGLSAHTGGGLTYLAEQMRELAGLAGDHVSLTIFATDSLARACNGLPNVKIKTVPALPLAARIPFEQLCLPALVAKADVVYCPGNFALFLSSRPQVVTFQNPNHFGFEARRVRRTYYSPLLWARKSVESWAARRSLRKATTCLAISESLRATMLEDVENPGDLRLLLSAAPKMPSVADGSSSSPGYALAVANDYPHKDWDGLIECFTSHDRLPRLILVGAPRGSARRRRLERRISNAPNPEGVTLRGVVSDRAEMASIYAGAAIYIAHSRLEAFPLTPYEAMASGLPVIASDIPPHREVCGDGAAYYPVDDLGALARLLAEGSQQRSVAAPPIDRSWHDNAAELALVLRSAAR